MIRNLLIWKTGYGLQSTVPIRAGLTALPWMQMGEI
jgi:hypothetical protein